MTTLDLSLVDSTNDALMLFDKRRYLLIEDRFEHRGRGLGLAGKDGALYSYINKLVSTEAGIAYVKSALNEGAKPGIWFDTPENTGNKLELSNGCWIWKPGALGSTLKYFYEFYSSLPELEIKVTAI